MASGSEHLRWLESERSKRTFNFGDYNARVTPDQIRIWGKISSEYGDDVILDRSRTRTSISTVSRTPLFMFYVIYPVYAFGFLMFFIAQDIAVETQISIFALAIFMMFTPLVLDKLLPTNYFLIATAVFYVGIFSLSKTEPLTTAFKAVEESVSEGYVETFIIFASLLPLLIRRMIGQMMIGYRLKLDDGSRSFQIETESAAAPAMVEYLRKGYVPGRPLRLPAFLMALSRRRMKSCQYCGESTTLECHRCYRPMCSAHSGMLRGYKVCLDCFVERRGKIKRNLR